MIPLNQNALRALRIVLRVIMLMLVSAQSALQGFS